MKPDSSKIISFGAFLAALGVVLGAFGAHGLRGKIDAYSFDVYQTANQYLIIHAMALIFYGLWRKSFRNDSVKILPSILFAAGILIFCGSLYALVSTGIRMFGAITPIGGLMFIAGWIGFAWQAKGSRVDAA